MEWPCRVDVSRVLQEGESISLEDVVESPGLFLTLASLPPGRPITLRLSIEAVEGGVRAAGEVEAEAELVCSRCLAGFRSGLRRPVEELFSLVDGEEGYGIEAGGFIELGTLLRDNILEALPFSPRCREDCRGLCPTCGKDLNTGPCSCREREADPRWEALRRALEGPG